MGGVGVIPRSKVAKAAEELGISIEPLASDIRAMDGVYLDYVREMREAEEQRHKQELELQEKARAGIRRKR